MSTTVDGLPVGAKLLMDEPGLPVFPSLAVKVGLNEAILLQQIHFALRRDNVLVEDERRWVKLPLQWWLEKCPFWSEATIKRGLHELHGAGLVSRQRGQEGNVYSINYTELFAGTDQPDPSDRSDRAKAPDQDDPSCVVEGRTAKEGEREPMAPETGADESQLFGTGDSKPEANDEDQKVQEVWDHYFHLFQDRLNVKELTNARKAMIRKALKAVEWDTSICKRAINGLKSYRETHPGGSKDVSLDAIFKTRPGGSNLTDQIEWWVSQAGEVPDIDQSVPSVLHGRVHDARAQVIQMYRAPSVGSRERGEQSLAWLREHAKEEPIIVDDQVSGWQRVS